MQLLFVCQAGFDAGLGHLLRSRALMIEAKTRGHDVHLWLSGERSALDGRNWTFAQMHAGLEGTPSLPAVCAAIEEHVARGGYDWIVVDGYDFLERELLTRWADAAKLLVLDDMATQAFRADVVLNQNSSCADIYRNGGASAQRFLLGPSYALIDSVYRRHRAAFEVGHVARRVLVTFGGVDRHDRTRHVIGLIMRGGHSLRITAVLGPYYPYEDRLRRMGGGSAFDIKTNVGDLSSAIAGCDFMVTAAGSTVWQSCCIGTPMIALKTVDNQRFSFEALREAGAAVCIDVSQHPEIDAGIAAVDFEAALSHVMDFNVRHSLSKQAMALVDGEGAARVVQVLEGWG